MNIQLTDFDSCTIFLSGWIITYSAYTRCVIFLKRLIYLILLMCTETDIASSIIQCIKIDMIQHDLAVKGLCDVFQLDDFFHGSAPKIKKVTHALRHTSLEKPIIPGTQPEYIKPLLV